MSKATQRRVTGRGRRRNGFVAALVTAVVATGLVVAPTTASAADPVTADQLVVTKVGTGAATLGSAATAAFLQKLSSDGTVGDAVALPTATADGTYAFTLAGSGATEGQLRRSPDGTHVTLTGYRTAPGTSSVAGTASATIPRAVARLDANGTLDTSTALTGVYTKVPLRGAVTVDGTGYWVAGDSGEDSSALRAGVRYIDNGVTGAGTALFTEPRATNHPAIVDGQLQTWGYRSGYYGVNTVGTGTPKTASTTALAVTGTSSLTYGHVALTRGAGATAYDTVYVAAGTSGILKYSKNPDTGAWAQKGSIAGSYFAIDGRLDGDQVKLYAVSGSAAGNQLVALYDTAAQNDTAVGSSPVTVATAPTNTAFRGVTFAPGSTFDEGTTVPGTITLATSTLAHVLSATGNATTSVTVGHPSRPVSDLTVSAVSSSNPTVAATTDVTIAGSGATRTVTVTPKGVGHTDLTLAVRAPGGVTATTVLHYSVAAAGAATTTFPAGVNDIVAMADAGSNHVLAASSTDAVIRLFDSATSTAAVTSTDLSASVGAAPAIRGAARIGDRTYWVGRLDTADHNRFFATDHTGTGAATTTAFVGSSSTLREDLLAWDATNVHGLGAGHFGLAANLAVSGLVPGAAAGSVYVAVDGATADGNRALLVPVTNPEALVTSGAHAAFGTPIRLNLSGLAVRDIVANAAGTYVILAGPADGSGAPTLFLWNGNPATTPVKATAPVTGTLAPAYRAIAPLPAVFKNRSTVTLAADLSDVAIYGDSTVGRDQPVALRRARLDKVAYVAPVNGSTNTLPDELVAIQILTNRSWDDYPSSVQLAHVTTDGTVGTPLALPTEASGGNYAIAFTDGKEDEAYLTRSGDGNSVTMLGYDAKTGGTRKPRENAAKVVANVSANGTIDTSTRFAYGSLFSSERARSAVTEDGTKFWMTGDSAGVRLADKGATTHTAVATSPSSGHELAIVNGQLYVSSGSAIQKVGSGVPTATGQTLTTLATRSQNNYVLLQVDPASDGIDTIYSVDEGSAITKMVRNGTTWTTAGTVGSSYYYLTGRVNDAGQVELYGVSGLGSYTSGNSIRKIVDTAAPLGTLVSGGETTLATAQATTAFRGIQFAPGNVVPQPAVVVPGAPTDAAATAGDASATVTWTAPTTDGGSPVTNYVVTPHRDGVAQTPIITTDTATSLQVTGLANDVTYTFTVTAENAIGQSAASNATDAVTPEADATAPDAPTGVSAVAGDATATVTWTAPASNGGSPITWYQVTVLQGGSPVGTRLVAGTETSTEVDDLTNGTAYTFTVTAINAVGSGSASDPSSPVTPVAPPTVPGAPTAVTAAPGDAQAVVSWTAPTGPQEVTGYQVTPTGPDGPLAPIVVGNITTATVTGLTNGTAYTFTVAAINAVGTGAESAASDPVTPVAPVIPPTVPGAPTDATAVAGDAQAVVSWTAPTDDGRAAISGYRITPSTGGTPLAAVTVGNVTHATVTGLTNGTAYTFTVAAINAVGTGADSSPTTAVTPVAPVIPPTVPGAPTGATAVAGDAQAVVSWTAPASDGRSPITGYRITPKTGSTTLTPITVGPVLTTTVTGLTNGTAYTFTIAAINAVGTSGESAATASVTPRTVPGVPTGVTATAGNAQVSLTWTAPTVTGGSAITGYTVVATKDGVPQTPLTLTGTTTSTTVPGLTNGSSYTFTVAARNAVGTGSASAASAAVTPRTVPGAPTAVTGTAGNGEVALTWAAPASDGGAAIVGYTVTPYRSGIAQTAIVLTGTETATTVTGLTNGTAYTFTVTARNAAGAGSASTASAAVTPSTVPGAPTNAKATLTGTLGTLPVTVTWTAPASNGGAAISGYVVTPYVGGTAGTPVTLGNVLTTTFTDLPATQELTFTVVAVNANGPSAASVASTGVTAKTVPGTPAAPTVTAGDARIAVSWAAPSTDGGSAITGYVVTVTPATGSPVVVELATTATTTTVKDLTNGTAYVVTVAARNAVGVGTASAASRSVTPAAPVAPNLGRTASESFVEAVFRDLLNRAPYAYEVTAVSNDLDNGVKTKAQVVEWLQTTASYYRDQVTMAYGTILLRKPTAGELDIYTKWLQAGNSIDVLRSNLIGSDELWNGAGKKNLETWATVAYGRLTGGLKPTTADLSNFRLVNYKKGRAGVAAFLITLSPVHRARTATLLTRVFAEPAAAGRVSNWSGVMKAWGYDRTAKSLIVSSTYQGRAEARFP